MEEKNKINIMHIKNLKKQIKIQKKELQDDKI